jgi:hypothetical protein
VIVANILVWIYCRSQVARRPPTTREGSQQHDGCC